MMINRFGGNSRVQRIVCDARRYHVDLNNSMKGTQEMNGASGEERLMILCCVCVWVMAVGGVLLLCVYSSFILIRLFVVLHEHFVPVCVSVSQGCT